MDDERGHDRLRKAEASYQRYRTTRPDDFPSPNPGARPKRVAIIGKGPMRLTAPWGVEGWELWGMNDDAWERKGVPGIHAHTRWLQVHPPRYLRVHYPDGLRDLERSWGTNRGVRLYMDRHYPEYPDSEPFPKADVEALTSSGWYHASSFDWLVSLAVLEGFEEIALFGCNLYSFPIMNGEPISARACLEYWIGVAEGRGAKVASVGNGHIGRIIHLAAYESGLQYGFDPEPGHDLSLDSDWRDLR